MGLTVSSSSPRLALVSRRDPLTRYLHRELAGRFPIVADINVELTGIRRALVAARTLRWTRDQWAETYLKSSHGWKARSASARHDLDDLTEVYDAIVQTHALFDTDDTRSTIYIDCTFRQALQGWPAWTPHGPRGRNAWLALETAAYQRAAHLFAFADPARDSLVRDYGIASDRVTVVGAGLNFDAMPAPRQPRRNTAPIILFVGSEFVRKGGDVLLRAFATVRRRNPAAILRIVGTNVPSGAPEGVEVIGAITDRTELAAFYETSTVFCMPSRFDPGPLVVLEAMAHGLPYVATRQCSLPAMFEDGSSGRIVEADDVEALADALTQLLNDGDLAESLGSAARRRVENEFLWTHVVDRMTPALEALAVTGDEPSSTPGRVSRRNSRRNRTP